VQSAKIPHLGEQRFEKLDVYQRSVELVVTAARTISELSEQLKRAALSVPVHIAEGVGRTSLSDCRAHYAITRGSAMECAAILDACRALNVAAQAHRLMAVRC
jgi:four helix bundle protein